MIDYRKILIAYVEHVSECEGVDFIDDGPAAYLDGLTEEEAVELAKIRDIGRRAECRSYEADDESTPAAPPESVAPAADQVPPPGTVVIGMAFTPHVIEAMRKFGWLTGEATPEAVALAARAWMSTVWKASEAEEAAREDGPRECRPPR
jgi:hypothetical protein